MSLHARVVTAHLDLELSAPDGQTLALVGPNGAGKTSALRAIAGLAPGASVTIDGTDLTPEPPHRRRIGFVPQGAALFPHLSALGNVAYGLRAAGARPRDARCRAAAELDRLGVAHLADRRPAALSGGEQQRIALARALAPEPWLLLLDEPLAALDVASRVAVRRALRAHLATYDGVCLLVTHDPVEAATLADRLVVLESGRVIQDAPPDQVTRQPRSAWVAGLLGWNAWTGMTTESGLALDRGGALLAAEPLPPGLPALAAVHPAAVALHLERPTGSPRNAWLGTIDEVSPVGSRLRVHVMGSPSVVAEITPAAAAELAVASGRRVWVAVKASEVRLALL